MLCRSTVEGGWRLKNPFLLFLHLAALPLGPTICSKNIGDRSDFMPLRFGSILNEPIHGRGLFSSNLIFMLFSLSLRRPSLSNTTRLRMWRARTKKILFSKMKTNCCWLTLPPIDLHTFLRNTFHGCFTGAWRTT